MPSRRITPLPKGWYVIKKRIKERDAYRCTWIRSDGNRCYNTTELEVDHIGDPDDHSDDNLRTLCKGHHASRTGAQAGKMSVLRRFGS